MKKLFLMAAIVAAGLVSCQKTEVTPNENSSDPIAISAFAGTNTIGTKSAIDGTTFPDGYDMVVAAYMNSGTATTASQNWFPGTKFTLTDATNKLWTGSPARYWPVGDAKLDFLCIASAGLKTAANGIAPTTTTWGTTINASQVVLELPDNATAPGATLGGWDDVLYGAANNQTYASDVDVTFKHAMAAVTFCFKTNSTMAYTGDNVTKNYGVKINYVKINDACYGGTLTVSNPQAGGNTTADAISAAWSAYNTKIDSVRTRVWDNTGNGIKYNEPVFGTTAFYAPTEFCDMTAATKKFGDCYVILPQQAAARSFTINFTILNGKNGDALVNNTIEYTYTCTDTWQMGKKYIYKVYINPQEVKIDPAVTDWDAQTATDITIE